MVDWGRIGAGIATMGASEMARDKPFGSSDWSVDRGANEFRDVDPDQRILGQVGLADAAANEADRRFYGDQRVGEALGSLGEASKYYGGIMQGRDSLAMAQMRQGMGQALAQQQALAAGARGGNAAMAGRNASLQMGRIGAGMAGQAALQGIQERQMAAQGLTGAGQAYGNIALQQRGQNLDAMNAQRHLAFGGLNNIEQQRGNRFNALMQQPTKGEMAFQGTGQAVKQWKDIGTSAAQALGSDIRMKEGIQPGNAQADAFMDSLRPYTFQYKPDAQARDDARRQRIETEIGPARIYPRGAQTMDLDIGPARVSQPRRLGIMAQELERTPLGAQAVMQGPHGKMVDSGQLSMGLAAGIASLNERLREMERRGR